jgi:MFS superfamily sulfate permease-like transporter
MSQSENRPGPENEIKKPSLLSQLVPYLFTALILVFVFTMLSSNVMDERHELKGNDWTELTSRVGGNL